MCGISGYFGKKNISLKLVQETLNLMKNRGPDSQSFKSINSKLNNIFFLSSRLKIVDRVDRSNQPMEVDDLMITYNGEIYNIDELTNRVIKNGLKLKTKSDTELILKMYQIYGINCVNYFDGMWAFAIYDKNKSLLYISRDRIGEKPLYFYQDANGVYFASQTKFVRCLLNNYRTINDQKILNYLKFGYKSIEQQNQSFFKNIFKIEAGTNYIINNNLSIKKIKYWQPTIKETFYPIKKFEDLIKSNFKKKVNLICNTDLKLGLSLSGGIDSNFILSYLTKILKKNISTYSIIDKFSEKYDEEKLINRAVYDNKVQNHKIFLTDQKKNFINLKKLINYHDKPVSTISIYLQSLIYKKMKNDGVKICITGNGADELFAGYYHHYNLYYNSIKNNYDKYNFKEKWKKNIFPIIRNNEYKNLNKKKIKSYYSLISKDYLKSKKNISELKDKFFSKNLLRNKMLNELLFQTVPLSLTEDDLNSMYYSIENRSPFLNKELVETSFMLPTQYLMKDSYNKYILRQCSKGILDDEIRLNREKKGFNASFESLFSFNNKIFSEWFFDKDSKNPIYNYLDKKYFIKNFKKNSKNLFSDMSTQTLFSISSAKLFLEGI